MWDDLQEMSREYAGKKRCVKCKTLKPLTEFYSSVRELDGLECRCKKCHKEKTKSNKYRTQKGYLGLPNTTKRQYDMFKLRYAATHEQIEKYVYTTSCELCGVDLPIGPYLHKHFDHCHTKGMYRGTLCNHCNRALGAIEHDSHGLSPKEWCERALKYLNEPREE